MKRALIAIVVTFLVVLCSCAKNEYKRADFFAMNTYASFLVDTENENILSEAKAEVQRIEKLLSATYDGSDIQNLSSVSEETFSLLEKAHNVAVTTDGCFDYTLGALVKLWNVNGESPKVPSEDEIERTLETCGYENLSLSEGIIETANSKLQIDLGAVAKGYAGGRICAMLKDKGVENACISLGGNISVIGSSRNNLEKGVHGWNVGITDPYDTSHIIGFVNVSEKTVSVSGSYERFFEENGKKYHHIFDRTTGYPAETDLLCVAVISDDGTLADALSTALFVMGYDKAKNFYEEKAFDFEAVFCKKDGSVYVTDGIFHDFVPEENANVVFPQYE